MRKPFTPFVAALQWFILGDLLFMCLTGYYIYDPFFGGGLTMAWILWAHYIGGALLIESTILRIEQAVAGSKADGPRLWPGRRTWRLLRDELGYLLFLRPRPADYGDYTPLQTILYGFFWPVLIFLQAGLGFALFHGPFGWGIFNSDTLFGWINQLLGGLAVTRLLHFLIMWVFVITLVINLYLGVWWSWIQRRGFGWLRYGFLIIRRAAATEGQKMHPAAKRGVPRTPDTAG